MAQSLGGASSVLAVPYRFYRTGFHGSLALGFFVGSGRLFVDVGIAVLVVASEIVGRFGPAGVAVDTLIVYKVTSVSVI